MRAAGRDCVYHIWHFVTDFPWAVRFLRDIPNGFAAAIVHIIHLEHSRSRINRILDFSIFGLFELGHPIIFHLQIFAADSFDCGCLWNLSVENCLCGLFCPRNKGKKIPVLGIFWDIFTAFWQFIRRKIIPRPIYRFACVPSAGKNDQILL
jgi:hypothetical protein